ncbi:hypothetical protein [Clostridium sp. BJN0013]
MRKKANRKGMSVNEYILLIISQGLCI